MREGREGGGVRWRFFAFILIHCYLIAVFSAIITKAYHCTIIHDSTHEREKHTQIEQENKIEHRVIINFKKHNFYKNQSNY